MPFKVDPASHIPLHVQVEALLRQLIERPEHRAGAKLPDEIGLAKRLGISRNTVRAAIGRLASEGLLERRRGVGTHVVLVRAVPHRAPWDGFLDEIEPRTPGSKTLDLAIGRIPADAVAARMLQVAPGDQMTRVERLLGDEHGPVSLVVSWLHPRIELSGTEDFTRPLWVLLENDLGIIPARIHEEVRATLADAATSRRLGIKRGAAVLERRRVVADAQRRPLEFAIASYRADRHARAIEIERDHRS